MRIYYKKMDECKFKKLKKLRESAKRRLEKIEEKINKEEHTKATMIAIEATKKSEIEEKLRKVLREYLEFLEENYL